MDLRKFITLLKSDLPGLIFWRNLCAHWNEQLLDINIAASIFNQARKTIDRHKWSDDSDGSAWAYQSIINETSVNKSKTAMLAMTGVPDLDWSKIKQISTLINDESFWKYYVKFNAVGHDEILETVGVSASSLESITEANLRGYVLQALKTMSEHKVDVGERLWDSMCAGGSLRTAADRFWASFDDQLRCTTADKLVPQLGLTNFKIGQWVIEILFEGAKVKELLDKSGIQLKRPSALCINDADKPRFRALRPDEVNARNVHSDNSEHQGYKFHGTTLDINHWSNATTKSDMNGLPELFCPQLPWKNEEIKPSINVLGPILEGGPAEKCLSIPSNSDYADYLMILFNKSSANDESFIVELEAKCG